MFTRLLNFFGLQNWGDIFTTNGIFNWHFLISVVDILVVWYLVYKLIMLVRGTQAMQLVKGIAVIILIRYLSGVIGLITVSWIMDQVITYGVIAVIVIFQPEVRRGLEHIGRGALGKKRQQSKRQEVTMINSFDKAIQYMARRKIGALITIERKTGLDEYIETGIPLEADISGELLINIFIPNTPLHDGAVIVRNNKVAVACAYLPLSESTTIPKEFGTRHRAAVGISEVSDAVTIIVSEETGDVSLAINNELMSHLSQDEYMSILTDYFVPVETEAKQNPLQSLIDGFTKGAKK